MRRSGGDGRFPAPSTVEAMIATPTRSPATGAQGRRRWATGRLRLAIRLGVLMSMLFITACGDGATEREPMEVRTAANGEEFNDADVAFASDLVQHHAQALVMVDLTLGRHLDPQVQELADEIRTAQTAQIEQMTDWLVAWDEPVPETARDHANAHGDGEAHGDGSDLAALEAATGEEFARRWLELMVEHHEGAIELARREQEAGHADAAIALAEQVEAAQRQRAARMTELLED